MELLSSKSKGGFAKILLNTGWLTIARVVGDVAGVLLFIAISRHLGLEAVGQYSHAFALATLVAALVGIGLDEYGLREYSRLNEPAQKHELLGRIIGVQLGLLVVVCLCLLVYLLFLSPAFETVILVAIVTTHVLTFQFALMYFIPAFAHQKMLRPAVAEILCRAGGLCLGVVLIVFHGAGLITSVVPLALGTTVLLIVAMMMGRQFDGGMKISLTWSGARKTVMATWPFAASTIVYNLYSRLPVIMLASMAGDGATGIYATAMKLYEFGLMPLYMLSVAAYPALSKSYGAHQGFAGTADKLLRSALVVSAILAWGLMFVAPLVLEFLLGSEFVAAKSATRLMAVVAVLGAVDVVSLRMMLAMNLQNQRFRIQTTALCIYAALNLFLIPQFGPMGAIVATMIAQLVMIGGYFWYFSRDVEARQLLSTLARFTVWLAAVVVVAALLHWVGVGDLLLAAVTLVGFLVVVQLTGFVPSPRQMLRSSHS